MQFHPESILTRDGKRILQNLLEMAARHATAAPPDIVSSAAIQQVLERNHLTTAQAESVMMQIMDGTPRRRRSAPLAALRAKGETIGGS